MTEAVKLLSDLFYVNMALFAIDLVTAYDG